MRLTKLSATRFIGLALLLWLSHASTNGQSIDRAQWGAPVKGVQIAIAAAASDKAGVPEFQIAFQNSGEHEITLNVGIMLANGRVKLPDKISLNITDASGQTRRLRFSDKRYAAVAGRVDDYLISIRGGSVSMLIVRLDQFWSPETKEFDLKLAPGKYQVTAEFEGEGTWTTLPDLPGIDIINLWSGKLQSNTLEIER